MKLVLPVILTALIVTGCVDQNTLTKEEIAKQNKADSLVSGLLFEQDVDEFASYNIRKDGFVVIKFDKSVPSKKYTEIVETLRSSSELSGVRAEQGGVEVCPIRR